MFPSQTAFATPTSSGLRRDKPAFATDHHTKEDWAQVIKELVDEHFPEKKKIVLVMDNLNTHKLSSLYTAFKPEEARRIAERLEIHYTPKHGSWLDRAELEIGVDGSAMP